VSLAHYLGVVWFAAAVLMIGGWMWQRQHHNAGIVDALWASGLGASAALAATCAGGAPAPRVITAACGTLWGARLALHLWHRVRAGPEDGRYRALRERWGAGQLRWFLLFQFQAGLIALFCVPFFIAAGNPATRPAALVTAVIIWVMSVGGESMADRQLASFLADPANRGRACRAGLWRYSRHPNYFFEWLHWFSYVAIALGSPLWAWSLAGPLTMFVFLRWVSGIPFTEAQAVRTRGADYLDYQARTAAFFPWPPRARPAPVSTMRSRP
jgi:steroid 5-alpha reductase family enzyme